MVTPEASLTVYMNLHFDKHVGLGIALVSWKRAQKHLEVYWSVLDTVVFTMICTFSLIHNCYLNVSGFAFPIPLACGLHSVL